MIAHKETPERGGILPLSVPGLPRVDRCIRVIGDKNHVGLMVCTKRKVEEERGDATRLDFQCCWKLRCNFEEHLFPREEPSFIFAAFFASN